MEYLCWLPGTKKIHRERLLSSTLHRPSPRQISRKKILFFLDGFSSYNQICISLEDKDRKDFTFPWGNFIYEFLPFGIWNAPTTFHRDILGIFSDFIHDCVEWNMDDRIFMEINLKNLWMTWVKFLKGVEKQISHLEMKNYICY